MGTDLYLIAQKSNRISDQEFNKKIKLGFKEMSLPLIGNKFSPTNNPYRIKGWIGKGSSPIEEWVFQIGKKGQDYLDDDIYYLSIIDLTKLSDMCQKILSNKNEVTGFLPPPSEEYDDFYFNQIEHISRIVGDCLELGKNWDFYYKID